MVRLLGFKLTALAGVALIFVGVLGAPAEPPGALDPPSKVPRAEAQEAPRPPSAEATPPPRPPPEEPSEDEETLLGLVPLP